MAGHPDDPVAGIDHQRHPVPVVSRHLPVDEHVLQLLPAPKPERPKRVAGPSRPDPDQPGGRRVDDRDVAITAKCLLGNELRNALSFRLASITQPHSGTFVRPGTGSS